MKLLALDISTCSTGYSVWEDSTLVTYGTITHSSKDFLERGQYMADYVGELVKKYGEFDFVVVEEIKVMKNQAVVVMLALVQGLLVRELKHSKAVFIGPTVWRKMFKITGKREAMKRKAIEVCEYLGHSVRNDDESEAILIGRYCVSNQHLLLDSE